MTFISNLRTSHTLNIASIFSGVGVFKTIHLFSVIIFSHGKVDEISRHRLLMTRSCTRGQGLPHMDQHTRISGIHLGLEQSQIHTEGHSSRLRKTQWLQEIHKSKQTALRKAFNAQIHLGPLYIWSLFTIKHCLPMRDLTTYLWST